MKKTIATLLLLSCSAFAVIPPQEVIEAALYGKIDTIEKALAEGYKPDTRDPENRTALMWAAAEGQIKNVKLLLKHKADVSLKDVDGDTAESFAAQKGHTAIVKILQEAAPKKAKTKEEKKAE